jgi:hypothetical protein
VRKRLKKKKRSCALCKPHKTGGADKRTVQQVRRDQADKVDYGYIN